MPQDPNPPEGYQLNLSKPSGRYTRSQFAQLFVKYHADELPDGAKPEDYNFSAINQDKLDDWVDQVLEAYPIYKNDVETRQGHEVRRMGIPAAPAIAGPQPALAQTVDARRDVGMTTGAPTGALAQRAKGVEFLNKVTDEYPSQLANTGKGMLSGATAGLTTIIPEAIAPKGVPSPVKDALSSAFLPAPGREAEFAAGQLPGALASNIALQHFAGPAGPAGYAAVAEGVRQVGRVQAGQQSSLNLPSVAAQGALGYLTAAAPANIGQGILPKIATGAGIGTLTGGLPIAMQQIADTGTIDWNDPQLKRWALAGGAIGGALPLTAVPAAIRGLHDPATPFPVEPWHPQPDPNAPVGQGQATHPDGRVEPIPVYNQHAATPTGDPVSTPPAGWNPVPGEMRFGGKKVVGWQSGPEQANVSGEPVGYKSWHKILFDDGTEVEVNPKDPQNYTEGGATRSGKGESADPRTPFWAQQEGKLSAEIPATLAGMFAGGATGAAASDDDNKWMGALAGAVVGGLGGAALSGAIRGAKPDRVNELSALKQYPVVEARLQPNVVKGLKNSFIGDLNKIRTEWGKTFETFHGLKQHGATFQDAIGRFQRFNNTLYEIPQMMKRDILDVLEPLKDPSDFNQLWSIVRLRRDIEKMSLQGQTQPLGPNPVKGGKAVPVVPEIDMVNGAKAQMNALQAQTALANLEGDALRTNPQVLTAADRFRTLMKRIATEIEAQGRQDPAVAQANPNYFPDYVIDQLLNRMTIPAQPLPGIRAGKQGYRKQWTGKRAGAGTTLRDFVDVTGRRLMEHYTDIEKHKLIQDLGMRYDPYLSTGQARPQNAPPPAGYDYYTFDRRESGGHHLASQPNPRLTYLLPKPLIDELNYRFMPVNKAVEVANRWTNNYKGVVIRGQGPIFVLKNVMGDHVNLYGDVSPLQWPSMAVAELKAIKSMIDQQWPGGKLANNTMTPMFDRARQAGIGASAAAAEVSEQVMRMPEIRDKVVPLKTGSPLDMVKGAKRAVVNATDDLWVNPGNEMRDWGETIPRLTSFIYELGQGRTDIDAGRITAHRQINYQDLTPREKTWARGLLAPFYTFQKKNFQNVVPGAGRDAFGSRKGQAINAAKRLAKFAIPGAAAIALWNQQMFPDQEADMDPWLKDQPHIIVPYGTNDDGSWKLMYLTFSGPGNSAGRMVGLGGAVPRAMNLATGRTDLKTEVARSGKQIQEAWMGQVGPIVTLPYALATGKDLRTGKSFSPENASFGEKAFDTATGVALSIPPLSTMFRAGLEGRTADESLGRFALRATVGSLGGKIDPKRNALATQQRMLASARADDTNQQELERHEAIMSKDETLKLLDSGTGKKAVPTKGLVMKIGPAATMNMYMAALDMGTEGAPIAAALRDIAADLMSTQNRNDWEMPYRLMATIQNAKSFPATAVPELAEKAKQRANAKKPLF